MMDHKAIRYAANYSDLPHYRAVPVGYTNNFNHAVSLMDSASPATSSHTKYAGPTIGSNIVSIAPTWNGSIYAPPYRTRYRVTRFLGDGYADTDPDAILGRRAMRSRWYLFSITAAMQVLACNPPLSGIIEWTASVYLLDQYFDYLAVSYNNMPALTGARADFVYSGDGNSQDGVMYAYSALWIEVPRLTLDDRPVPIYGYLTKIAITTDPTGAASISHTAALSGWHDDERVPYEWYVNRIQPTAAEYYKGEFLPL